MSIMSALIRTSAVRVGAMALAAAFAIGAGVAPASARAADDNGRHLGWNKNGKAAEKERRRDEQETRKAARLNQRDYRNNGSAYVYQGGTVDRTRVIPQ